MSRVPATADDLSRHATKVIARGSKSFAAASRLFPGVLRRDVRLLYVWCRHCDDLTDGQHLGHGRIEPADQQAIAKVRADSLAALRGSPPPQLPYLALSELASRQTLPLHLVEAHIRGFELDAAGWQPRTLDDTIQYCYHTAGTVGMMMAGFMGVSDALILNRARDLGIALQMTNIARDVVEDARATRCYLPQSWLTAAGLSIQDLTDLHNRERVFPLVQRMIDEAEPYYRSAALGFRALPHRASWAVASAGYIYRDIGQKILERGPEVLGRRVHIGPARKVWHICAAIPAALARRSAHGGNCAHELQGPT